MFSSFFEGKNNKHGRAEETQPRIGGANENGVVEFVEWDSRYAGGDNQLLKVGKGQRPQSAAVSYALHRQVIEVIKRENLFAG